VTFAGGVTLITPGDQMITATDTVSGIAGSATVTVNGPTVDLAGWGGVVGETAGSGVGRAPYRARQGLEQTLEWQAGWLETIAVSGQGFSRRYAEDAVFEGWE
jgi:hypothetical protein